MLMRRGDPYTAQAHLEANTLNYTLHIQTPSKGWSPPPLPPTLTKYAVVAAGHQTAWLLQSGGVFVPAGHQHHHLVVSTPAATTTRRRIHNVLLRRVWLHHRPVRRSTAQWRNTRRAFNTFVYFSCQEGEQLILRSGKHLRHLYSRRAQPLWGWLSCMRWYLHGFLPHAYQGDWRLNDLCWF